MTCGDLFLGLLAILFPPIAVWIKRGLCSADSLLNLLLCVLGYIPGLIHAWYIIAKFPDEDYSGYEVIPEDGRGSGRVTYYYVSHEPMPAGGRLPAQPSPAGAGAGAPDAGRSQLENERRGIGGPAAVRPQQPYRDEPEEGSAATPPTYAEAVKGDHKVQTD